MDDLELGKTAAVSHCIDTDDHTPIKHYLSCVPFSLRAKVSQLFKTMLDQRLIKYLTSPRASPVILVSKRDGSTRFWVDNRKLNAVTKMDVHPLPRIDDSLEQLAETKFCSTLDLASGYLPGEDGIRYACRTPWVHSYAICVKLDEKCACGIVEREVSCQPGWHFGDGNLL